MPEALIQATSKGLYCPRGDFHIDPWAPVDKAVVTHAHSDHARVGSAQYFCTPDGLPLLHHRLGKDLRYQPLPYGEPTWFNDVKVSLHPAGHILGSAQVRVEHGGQVWAFTGDYKRDPDPTCLPFEVVPCHTFITEATFALPIYRWQPTPETARQIFKWWQSCREQGRTALLFCYSLGKSQRVLSELMAYTEDPVYLHGAVDNLTQIYRDAGIPMLPTVPVSEVPKSQSMAGELVIAPPSAFRSLWMKRFKSLETGFASGWMRVRAGKRHRGYDRGFVLSDHADWPQLVQTVKDTGARQVLITHGRTDVLAHYLKEMGVQAGALKTHYGDEEEGPGDDGAHEHTKEGEEKGGDS